MDPDARAFAFTWLRFPRRRGDGPRTWKGRKCASWFPPQARGWTVCRRALGDEEGVSPAGAGMDPSRAGSSADLLRFPRRRGDGPRAQGHRRAGQEFPPQARGWTTPSCGAGPRPPVSPAGAGMDPRPNPPAPSGRCFPRRRGDGPVPRSSRRPRSMFPPQARGWTGGDCFPGIGGVVSPAGAGMDRRCSDRPRRSRRFPRRRGDGPVAVPVDQEVGEFPPQARGWTSAAPGSAVVASVSPAGAGMDPPPAAPAPAAERFPRRRGDGPYPTTVNITAGRFPPQARGWTLAHREPEPARIVSPAGAGMDLRPLVEDAVRKGFPRRRGDGPGQAGRHRRLLWVSPAGAGMDRRPVRGRARRRRFPRRRGDGPVTQSPNTVLQAFPPQARGWTLARRLAGCDDQVSPAGAGMDPQPSESHSSP